MFVGNSGLALCCLSWSLPRIVRMLDFFVYRPLDVLSWPLFIHHVATCQPWPQDNFKNQWVEGDKAFEHLHAEFWWLLSAIFSQVVVCVQLCTYKIVYIHMSMIFRASTTIFVFVLMPVFHDVSHNVTFSLQIYNIPESMCISTATCHVGSTSALPLSFWVWRLRKTNAENESTWVPGDPFIRWKWFTFNGKLPIGI